MQRRTFLLVSQVYVPDPASVGQHMADVAVELARRGHRVIVLTSNRGYEDPREVYSSCENVHGVEIRRLPLSSFGKKSTFIRVLGALSFTLQAALVGSCLGKIDAVVVSTSPLFAPIAALFIARTRRARITFWVMDLNPDQLVVLQILRTNSLRSRLLERLNRRILRRASSVVVLDRFMAARLKKSGGDRLPMKVLPPWPLEDHLEPVTHKSNPFRKTHALNGKLVLMYSGNHSPSHPLQTILDVAKRMRDDPRIIFVFVGGGLGKPDVDSEAEVSPNVRSLPYQPLSQLRFSLSAADIHLVVVGERMVGVVHPCKVYGAMAVARPVLFIGPEESHVADIVKEYRIGWRVSHGDVEGAERLLRALLDGDREELTNMGVRARDAIRDRFRKEVLCGRLCEVIESDSVGKVIGTETGRSHSSSKIDKRPS